MRILKIACILFASVILSVKASDNKPPILPEDSPAPKKYSCLNERYRDCGAIVSDHCRENSRPYWLLSLDGGGVRALLHLLSLERLENITGKPIAELVDGISGTSAGGVLACLLTMRDAKTLQPLYSAKFLLDTLLPTRDQMFVRRWSSLWGLLGPRYRSGSLERYFGGLLRDDKFKARSLPVVVVAHDLNSYAERLLSTTDAPDFLTKDLAVAISAAPTYFAPKVIRSISLPQVNHFLMDGATVMDNPVLA
ncbi:MAG: patatin-like phospholipase family protein, partial [Proteobacteria bacterium]|nr:patatin-like phospholipase family protein [Pseudomonadota bacterium]